MLWRSLCVFFLLFFFNDTATTEIYTLSLHDALPIYSVRLASRKHHTHSRSLWWYVGASEVFDAAVPIHRQRTGANDRDRKSTRLNSSHANISYAVFCLKKKNKTLYNIQLVISTRYYI